VIRRLRVDTRPLKHRDFRNLWIGQAVSTIGGEIGTVAVPYQAYTLTHSTALVGLLGLASLIPLLVVPLIGGAIADALDRRTVLLRTETGMAVVSALFLVNSLLPNPQVWALYVLMALAVAIFSLGRSAMSALPPRLIPEEEIAAASALAAARDRVHAGRERAEPRRSRIRIAGLTDLAALLDRLRRHPVRRGLRRDGARPAEVPPLRRP
jgi:MFS family permease